MNSTLVKPRCAYAHNLLDNSDFRAPVNQRGQAAYTTAWGYTLDRWYLADSRGGGEEAQTLEIVPGAGVRISGNHPSLVQRVPLLDDARMYTAAYLCDDGEFRCWTFQGASLNYHDLGFAQVTLIDQPVTLVWAALYEGTYTADTLPPYAPKGYAAELAECQRYTVKINTHTITAMSEWNAYYSTITYPVPMRANPTVTLWNNATSTAGTIGRYDNTTGTYVDFTGFFIGSPSNFGFIIGSSGQFVPGAIYNFEGIANADL